MSNPSLERDEEKSDPLFLIPLYSFGIDRVYDFGLIDSKVYRDLAAKIASPFRSPCAIVHETMARQNPISFKLADGTIKISNIFVSKVGEAAETRRKTVHEASGWYDAFTHDVFG